MVTRHVDTAPTIPLKKIFPFFLHYYQFITTPKYFPCFSCSVCLIGDEIYVSRLVSVNSNSILLSLILFLPQQYPISFPLLSLSLSFLFALKRVQVFVSAAFRSRCDLDPPQALSTLLHCSSINSRLQQIRFFDFLFLDLSHHGGRECSDYHERSPNCEFSSSFDLFQANFVFLGLLIQFIVLFLKVTTIALAYDKLRRFAANSDNFGLLVQYSSILVDQFAYC